MITQRAFRFGIVAAQARSASEWIATAQRAESLGFNTFLMPDTIGATWSPMPALAAVAASTSSIRLGTYVLANDFRHPVLLARECAALDMLSGGRFELGLGVGRPTATEDYRKLGMSFDPGGVRIERLAESVSIIKALFDGQVVTSSGRHYSVVGADIFPPLLQQPRPPLLIAGSGKRMLTLAAHEADIVALGARPDADAAVITEMVGWLREAAGDRFPNLEFNNNLLAVGQQPIPPWLRARFGIDPAELARSGSMALLMGMVDQMCEQLLERRARWGISYITAGADMMDALAPVVERLRGR